MADQDKLGIAHVDTVDQAPSSQNAAGVLTGDEAMIYQLETTGEQVGMTWRSIAAAGVSRPRHRIVPSRLIHDPGHGFILQRLRLHAPHATCHSVLYQC